MQKWQIRAGYGEQSAEEEFLSEMGRAYLKLCAKAVNSVKTMKRPEPGT